MQLPRGPGRQYPSPPSAGPAPSIILSGRGTTCLVKDTRPWSSSSWAAVGLRRTRDQGFRHVAGTLPDRPLGTDTAICGCLFGVLDTGRLFGSPWARWTPVSRAPHAIRPHNLSPRRAYCQLRRSGTYSFSSANGQSVLSASTHFSAAASPLPSTKTS